MSMYSYTIYRITTNGSSDVLTRFTERKPISQDEALARADAHVRPETAVAVCDDSGQSGWGMRSNGRPVNAAVSFYEEDADDFDYLEAGFRV